jgi:peroxiredoxin family protein
MGKQSALYCAPGKRLMDHSLVIFLHSSRYDRLYQAVNLLLTASSMQWKCHLFLFFDALGSFMEGKWDEINLLDSGGGEGEEASDAVRAAIASPWHRELQLNLESANFPSLYSLLENARSQEIPAKVVACSTSVRLLNLDTREVKTRVDEIIGLTTMLRIASEAQHAIYI